MHMLARLKITSFKGPAQLMPLKDNLTLNVHKPVRPQRQQKTLCFHQRLLSCQFSTGPLTWQLWEGRFSMRCKYGPNQSIFRPNKRGGTLLCGGFSVNYIAKGQISSAGIMQNPIRSGRPPEKSKMIDESGTSAKIHSTQSKSNVPYNRILSSKIIILRVINNHAKKGANR